MACAPPESSCTRSRPQAALREMEREMSAFNIPALDYTVRVMLRRGSRATTCLTAATSVLGLRSATSHTAARRRTVHSTVPTGQTLR